MYPSLFPALHWQNGIKFRDSTQYQIPIVYFWTVPKLGLDRSEELRRKGDETIQSAKMEAKINPEMDKIVSGKLLNYLKQADLLRVTKNAPH